MRTSTDALRSLGRYVSEALGEDWEVRFWADRGEFSYPFCRVQVVGPGPVSGPALYYEVTQPFSIECYPKPADDVETSIMQATAVIDRLLIAFRGRGVGAGRALRVPLYDYDGIGLTDGSTMRAAHDFMRLIDFSARPLPDVEDPRRVAAMADVRLAWTRGGDGTLNRDLHGDPVSTTQVVESVGLSFEADE